MIETVIVTLTLIVSGALAGRGLSRPNGWFILAGVLAFTCGSVIVSLV